MVKSTKTIVNAAVFSPCPHYPLVIFKKLDTCYKPTMGKGQGIVSRETSPSGTELEVFLKKALFWRGLAGPSLGW